MIPLELNSNLVLPIPGKKVLGIRGINNSNLYTSAIVNDNLLPSLAGDDNSIYLVDIFVNCVIADPSNIVVIQLRGPLNNLYPILLQGSITIAEPYSDRYIPSVFCNEILTTLSSITAPVGASLVATGYQLELVDI